MQSSSTLKEETGQHNVCERIQCYLRGVNSLRNWSSGVHMTSGGRGFVDWLLNWHPAEETAAGQAQEVKAALKVPLQMCSPVTWTKVYHYRQLFAGSSSIVSKTTRDNRNASSEAFFWPRHSHTFTLFKHRPILITMLGASSRSSSSAVCAHFNLLNLLFNVNTVNVKMLR